MFVTHGWTRVPLTLPLSHTTPRGQVLENSEGGTEGTLLAALNNCVTPAGRRRLRQWLCRPLAAIPDIEARQDAVAALLGPAEEAAATARSLFKGEGEGGRAGGVAGWSVAGCLGGC